MLDGSDRDAGVVAEHGTKREVLDVLDAGWNFRDHAAALGDKKTEPSIGGCRMQNNRNWRSAVDPRPCHLDLARNRSLSRADESIRHMRRPSMPYRRWSPSEPRRPPTPGECSRPKLRLALTFKGVVSRLRPLQCRDLANIVVNNVERYPEPNMCAKSRFLTLCYRRWTLPTLLDALRQHSSRLCRAICAAD